MSQHDMILADAAGAAFLADLNLALPALVSQNSGATAPATTYAYMWWADTTSGWLKQRDAANAAWILRAPLGTGAAVDVASAATLDLTANTATSATLRITGTTTTTAITLADGQQRLLRAAAAWPITHGASLIVPGSASYTCAAGDLVLAIGEAGGVVRLVIWKADGTPVVGSGITLGTPVATTSGTTKDFTGIPASAKRVTINFVGVSTSGTSAFLVQLGDSGGFETGSYSGMCLYSVGGGAANGTNNSAGFLVSYSATTPNVYSGSITLNLEKSDGTTWCETGSIVSAADTGFHMSAGSKSLSAALTQVRITTVSGDTFDAGEINISYE